MASTSIWTVMPGSTSRPDWPLEDGRPTIRVRADAADASWPAVHPGVFDATGGFRGHRLVVDFDVVEAGPTVLSLDFSAERGPCPDLEITLDETHRGLFHPRVIREDRTQTGEPGPVAGVVRLEVGFPSAWLEPGPHVLAITTALDPAAALGEDHDGATHAIGYRPAESLPASRAHYGRWFGSYLRWSKIELLTGRADPCGTEVEVRPTPFFIGPADAEVELIDVDITWSAGTIPSDRIAIEWPKSRTPMPAAPAERDFGMFRVRLAAPELGAPTTITVHEDHRSHNVTLTPCRRWTLHLIPHVHLDLGFTDAQGKVLELHCRNIDRALDRIAADPDFRFCVDGSMVAAEYSRTRPPAQVARMIQAVADGRLGVNAFHSNFLTGLLGLEEIYRSTDFSLANLPRSSSTGLRYANLTDVPTYSRSIASVLADLDIDGFVGMSNHGRAATDTSDALHLISPVRWQGPDGHEVLAHFADHYSQLRFIAADPQAVAGTANGLLRYLSRYERDDYLPSDLAVIGSHADNEDLGDGDVGVVDRWNSVFAWPRLRVSTFDEYLAAVAPLRDRLPLWRSETGSYWEDGVGSAAADFAVYRRAQALLPAAETLGALIATVSPNVRVNRAEFDRAWAGLSVAAEHTLTWARGTSHPHAFPVADQLGWKTRHIHNAYRVAIDEMRRQLAQLAEQADLHGPGVLAYNPHPWPADLDGEADLAEGTDLLDADGVVPVEVLTDCAGLRRVRFRLIGLAAHSWRYLPMTSGRATVPGGETEPPAVGSDPNAVNGFLHTPGGDKIVGSEWDVVLDPSTRLPQAIRHRRSGRDLLDATAAVRLGQIIRAGESPFSEHDSDQLAHPPDVHDHRRERTLPIENFRYVADPAPSRLVLESPDLDYVGRRDPPDGMRLRWRGQGVGISALTLDLLLRDDSATCDLTVSFVKQPCLDMEAVYVCFPFAGTSPTLRYDRPLGWVAPTTDHGPGAANEWAAVTNSVSVGTDSGEIRWTPLDAPLFTAGDIVRGQWPTAFPLGQSHLYSYAMNNFWPCNTPPWQAGPVTFRYRFALAEEFDPAASSRFGRIARVDAQVAEILPLDRYGSPGAARYREGSLGLSLPETAVDLQLRQHEDATRLTVHAANLSEHDVDLNVPIPPGARIERGPGGQPNTAPLSTAAFGTSRIDLIME